ncbi:MAG: hypothetical protein PUF76_08000, partial [bacterium]|nr:hypothetical protein [bacterium]
RPHLNLYEVSAFFTIFARLFWGRAPPFFLGAAPGIRVEIVFEFAGKFFVVFVQIFVTQTVQPSKPVISNRLFQEMPCISRQGVVY